MAGARLTRSKRPSSRSRPLQFQKGHVMKYPALKPFAIAAAFVAAAIAHTGASAQSYPSKPIRVITPYGAGGASDIVVRAGAHEMSKQLGQGIIVENRTGAGGTIG